MDMCYDGALVMPSSYVVMDEEEMMYVEGGISRDTAKNVAISALSAIIGGIVGHGVKNSLVGAAIKVAGTWVANVIDTVIIGIICYPEKAVAIAVAAMALGCIGYTVYSCGTKRGWW